MPATPRRASLNLHQVREAFDTLPNRDNWIAVDPTILDDDAAPLILEALDTLQSARKDRHART